MAKRKRHTTPKKIEQYIQEGRGKGHGSEYKPWITIQDVPSIGLAHRIRGSKHGRVHHLMSNLECDYFCLLDWSATVLDIREQYPLLPLATTRAIADDLGILHPRDPKTKTPIVMTTDFVIDLQTLPTEVKTIARTVKYAKDLAIPRIQEKFAIEREYWRQHRIDWKIITEKELPPIPLRNIAVLRTYRSIDDRGLSPDQIQCITKHLLAMDLSQRSLAEICTACDHHYGVASGASLCVAHHLIATGIVWIDLTKPFDPSLPLSSRYIQGGSSNARYEHGITAE